jgi:ADP-ribose pyrophosphatase
MSYRLVEKQVLYSGRKVQLELHHLEDEAGKRTQKEIAVHPGAVVVLPFVDEKTVLLIRNRRYAIQQILLELPAGTLEKGESPMNCAGRELQEETGHLARRIKPLINFYTSPGILSEKMYAFAAYDLTPTAQALEAGEDISVVPTLLEEAVRMCGNGQIVDGKSIATLLSYWNFFRGD